jgi:preprotein translocase subunit SecD
MKKNLLQRVIIIVAVTLAALYIVIGPRRWPVRLADFTPQGIQNTLRNNIRLGLDLKGGAHLLMQVQVDDYLRELTKNAALGIQTAAQEGGFAVREVRPEVAGGAHRIVLEVGEGADLQRSRDELPKRAANFDPSIWDASVEGGRVVWEMSGTAKALLAEQAVQQAKQIIDTRINAVGVAEPTLTEHGAKGSNQLLLQMPGERDPQRIKDLLKAQSRLELVHVISPSGALQQYTTREEAEATLAGLPPTERAKRRVLPYVERDEPAGADAEAAAKKEPTYVVVEVPFVVEGADLSDARAERGEAGGDAYQIGFNLKPRGAEKFGRWTGSNIGNYMGVVLDDTVKSIATIQGQITDSGRITGSFSKEQAEDLALTLRSGALPAQLKYLEDRTVGPTLGEDSIRAGVTASLVGLVLVVLFMVIYYKGAGINAVVALLLNMLITIAVLIWPLDATLTLPGIAGLILSIGMTVDTNVLIFERIREERLAGKTVASAVDQGFNRAFVTIIDTHVTTIVAALFLFVFGSGPIRGFAVTLILGLLANLFSGVYVSRAIFMWILGRKGRRAESLSI